jgi:hypothetical protein
MPGSRKRSKWPWAWTVTVLLLAGAALGVRFALRTPAGRAAANVAGYRARVLWSGWFGDRESTATKGRAAGAIGGLTLDGSGQPLPGTLVLVSTVRGIAYQATSDEQGAYRMEGVPPGRYVPVASKWGYEDALYRQGTEERTPVTVRASHIAAGVDIVLEEHLPWRPTIEEPAVLGPPETGYALFPAEVAARRVPMTYTNEGLVITTTQIYEPLDLQADERLPVVVASYPSEPLNWDRVSVALANERYVVLASGPSPQRGLDIHGMARDLIAAVAYLRDGQLSEHADLERQGWLGGSFSSLILYRALWEEPKEVDALVWVGGISDAFLWVQALYDVDLAIPDRYANYVASLGRPDRYPEIYAGYSAALHAARMPPVLIVHTTADEVIPYNQSIRFAETLEAAGVPHELFLYEDTTHYLDQVNITPETAELYSRLAAFLNRYVRNREETPGH